MITPPVRRVNRGRSHSYVDANGVKVPGVTTIIGDGYPKPGLIAWAGNSTADYAVNNWDELAELGPADRVNRLRKARFEERDAAANRGTQVHGLAEQLVAGHEVEVPDELAGHVESYVNWLDGWNVQPILVEFTVISYRHGYAGTGDLIADLPDPADADKTVRWLLDIKTNKSGVFGETALQLAAYRYADAYRDSAGDEHPIPPVERCGVVHVRSDGADLVPVEAGPAQHRAFLYVQQVAQFAQDANELIGDTLYPPRQEDAA